MQEWIFIGIAVFIMFLLIISSFKSELKDDCEVPYKDIKYNKEKEEMFYHPVTGYKGTRADMDAYIINREKELTNDK
ncbi:MAG TPA: hypothetical protein PLG47_06425 [Candidatus Dojkabacteria bacterium]|nr:hypothetical protein [Candidatus Dojkabacteria bacterium]